MHTCLCPATATLGMSMFQQMCQLISALEYTTSSKDSEVSFVAFTDQLFEYAPVFFGAFAAISSLRVFRLF